MKLMLSAFAGAMLLGAAFSTPAEARCWWNGWTTVCGPRYYSGYYRPYYRSHWRRWGYRGNYYRRHW
jgi:hypothetical protein